MGLLNRLFGNKAASAKKLAPDEDERVARVDAFFRHINDYYSVRRALASRFNFANVDKLLADRAELDSVMKQIEDSISPEIAHIRDDLRSDEKVIADLENLMSKDELLDLRKQVVESEQKQEPVRKLFGELLNVLMADLRLARIIMKKPSKELLLKLFELISYHEIRIYKTFDNKAFLDDNFHQHKIILSIAKAVLLEEKIEERAKTDAERFEEKTRFKITQKMDLSGDDTPKRYRGLAENVFRELAKLSGAPFSREEDITICLKKMESFMADDKLMLEMVKKFRPRYSDDKVRIMVSAFRAAYEMGHFRDLESEFAN